MNKPACLLTLILAACGGGGEDQAVSADPAPVNTPAAAAPTPAPSPTPVATPAPVAAAPVAQPPAAQPPAAPTPVARPAPPVATPDPSPTPAPAAPPAVEPIAEYRMACKGTPFYEGQQVWYVVNISINLAETPWKWLRKSEGTPQEFATDANGEWIQANPNPPNFFINGSGDIRPALYQFNAEGLQTITISNNGGKYDFPTICVRD